MGETPRIVGRALKEERSRVVEEALLHEMIQQWQQAVTGLNERSYHGPGRSFCDKCNEIRRPVRVAPRLETPKWGSQPTVVSRVEHGAAAKKSTARPVILDMDSDRGAENRPEGLVYVSDFVGIRQHDLVVELIEAHTHWTPLGGKRRLSFGFEYGVGAKRIVATAPPIPARLHELAIQIADAGLMREVPNQVTIQEYQPGQGIGKHIDAPCFGGELVTISLLSGCAMRFTRIGSAPFRQELEPRSALALSGPARSEWRHEISPHGIRSLRLSATFRTFIGAADFK
jgi:alkylated DNA repair dioxygenase AlkB